MSKPDVYQPPPPTLWDRFCYWRPIWWVRWRWLDARIAARRLWEDRAEIWGAFRARLAGEEIFASSAIWYGDSSDRCTQRHRVLVASGLWGWEPTGIEYEWSAPRDPETMEVVGDGTRVFFYSGLTFPTFEAARLRWKDDQPQ